MSLLALCKSGRSLALATIFLLGCGSESNTGAGGAAAGTPHDAGTPDGSAGGGGASQQALQATILSPTPGASVEEGEPLTFEGEAFGGRPPYQHRWTFDGAAADATVASPGEVLLSPAGSYEVAYLVTDSDGAEASETVTVTVRDLLGDMRFWFGNLHSHTGYSDGEGTPAEAFAWARDVAGFDFYAVTDHAEHLTSSKWNDTAAQADLFDEEGVFVALRGFEWSHPINGHVCVWNSDAYTAAYQSLWISSFYSWLADNGGFAQFNHPGRELTAFDGFNYDASVADQFVALETGNKSTGNNDGEFYSYYVQALDKGWRVAPTSNQDNHSLSTNSHRTVYVGPVLSRAGLFEAMTQRRMYSSDDPNIEVIFKQGQAWMGSTVSGGGSPLRFTVQVIDDEPILHLELVTNGGAVVAQHDAAGSLEVLWQPELTVPSGGYVFLKVTSEDLLDDDGPEQIAITAPIWVGP